MAGGLFEIEEGEADIRHREDRDGLVVMGAER